MSGLAASRCLPRREFSGARNEVGCNAASGPSQRRMGSTAGVAPALPRQDGHQQSRICRQSLGKRQVRRHAHSAAPLVDLLVLPPLVELGFASFRVGSQICGPRRSQAVARKHLSEMLGRQSPHRKSSAAGGLWTYRLNPRPSCPSSGLFRQQAWHWRWHGRLCWPNGRERRSDILREQRGRSDQTGGPRRALHRALQARNAPGLSSPPRRWLRGRHRGA